MFRRNKFVQTLTNNWTVKLCAFVLACVVFLFGWYYHRDSREITVPVTVSMPQTVTAVSTVPTTVKIIIKGDGDILYLIDPSVVTASVDFSSLTEPGIAMAPVVISYDQKVFKEGGISMEAQPGMFRVLFEGVKE